MSTAEHWALDNGFNELASDTEVYNELSMKIHKKLGFEEVDRIVCFLKKLE
jgi:aminoglycoside 6'-N-acetyltransferase I